MTYPSDNASPLFRIRNFDIRDFEIEWKVPAFIFDESCLIIGKETWQGPDDLSGRIQAAWCEKGVLVRAHVRDDDVVNDKPHGSLFARDSVEIFLAPKDGTSFSCGPTLQLVLAAPQPDGTIRHDVYCNTAIDTDSHFAAVGRLVDGGYEIQALLEWELLGYDLKAAKTHGLRMAFQIEDWDSTDSPDATCAPRTISLNGLWLFGKPDLWCPFNLEDSVNDKKDYNMSYYFPRLSVPRLICDGILKMSSPVAAQFDIFDSESGKMLASFCDTKDIEFECPPSSTVIKAIIRMPNDWGINAYIDFGCFNINTIAKKLAPMVKDTAHPDRQIQALGMLSCLEFAKCQSNVTSPQSRFRQELEWRQKRLAGENVSNAPGLLRLLNLMGESDGQFVVEFARNGATRATLTALWGTIPLIYATIDEFPTDGDAAIHVSRQLAFKTRITEQKMRAFDETWLARGHRFGDGCPWDLDIERLVSVSSDRNPQRRIRFVPEDALALSPVGYVRFDDAPQAMVDIMEKAGLKELSQDEAKKAIGHVVYVGTGALASRSSSYTYFHSLNGVETETLIARKGSMVITTSGNIIENGLELLEAIEMCRPITRQEIIRWRGRLLDHLGGDVPSAREDGRRLHSGDVHTHTNYSDGNGTPAGLLYEAAVSGMDFLVITDHGTTTGAERLVASQQKTGNRFPIIIGEEITRSKAYHLNFMPLTSCISQDLPFVELVKEAKRQGAVGLLNHPMTYGSALRKFWYSDFRGTGLDAIERHIEYIEKWRANGKAPVVLGSTDTHSGIFGHMERSVILADTPAPAAFSDAVRKHDAGMLAPDLAQYIVADKRVTDAVRAALGDMELPAIHSRQVADAFSDTDFPEFLKAAPDGTGASPNYGIGDPNEVIEPFDE